MNTSIFRSRAALWVAGAVGLLLAGAWVDGGEEPLRTISEPVSVSNASATGGLQ